MVRSPALRRAVCLVLACLMLSGCSLSQLIPSRNSRWESETTPPESALTEPSVPETEPPIAPPNGDPDTVACLGSYTGSADPAAVVATAGDKTLTAGMLQLYYGLEASSWRAAGTKPAPDWNQGLDTQLSPMETQAVTWQQFFLERALNTWHSCVALVNASVDAPLPLDPEYIPSQYNYKTYMDEDMPIMEFLYGYNGTYRVNTMHQAFIDALPQLLTTLGGADTLAAQLGGSGEDLLALAQTLNYAYGYYSTMRTYNTLEEEALQTRAGEYSDKTGTTVTFRHILLTGADAQTRAEALLAEFKAQKKPSDATFSVLANTHSQDPGSQLSGGLYAGIAQGQLAQELDSWLFDPARAGGDTEILTTSLGCHVVYFCSQETEATALARKELTREADRDFIATVREVLPMEVSYDAIRLAVPQTDAVSLEDLLYPDVAHEHIPDIPNYLQQDFPYAKYGAYPLVSYGCGITTLAMFATYMTDTWLTPPELARRYGHYCYSTGTDTTLIADSAPELGYFLVERTYDWRVADQYMREEGLLVMNLQYKGYFTRGGHYLILHHLNEDGTIAIRDSNIYNYGKLHPHKDNRFEWSQVTPSGAMYWIFQPKIVRIPACGRCGGETGLAAPQGLFREEYICPKCQEALQRSGNFLELTKAA